MQCVLDLPCGLQLKGDVSSLCKSGEEELTLTASHTIREREAVNLTEQVCLVPDLVRHVLRETLG